jgi:hypothetical protein
MNLKISWAWFKKRPWQLGEQICSNSHVFISINNLGNILWHIIDQYEKKIIIVKSFKGKGSKILFLLFYEFFNSWSGWIQFDWFFPNWSI